MRLAKKIEAGAQFIQTQLVFNVERFRDYMKRVVDMGLHEKTAIMVGIGPVRSARAAQFMATKVPGMEVPDSVIERLEGLSDEDAEMAGLDLCCEIGEALGLYPRPRLQD